MIKWIIFKFYLAKYWQRIRFFLGFSPFLPRAYGKALNNLASMLCIEREPNEWDIYFRERLDRAIIKVLPNRG